MKYAILSDIHANYHALHAVDQVVRHLRAIDGETDSEDGFPYWFLGDILGYGPQPIECLRWLEGQVDGKRWVFGNHDESVLAEAQKETTIDSLLSVSLPFNPDIARGVNHNAQRTWAMHAAILKRSENTKYMSLIEQKAKELEPEQPPCEEHDNSLLVFVHGSVSLALRRTEYLYPFGNGRQLLTIALRTLQEWYGDAYRTVCLLHGHTHFPGYAKLDSHGEDIELHAISYGIPIELASGYVAINPGSIGMPRDGDPRASFAILDTVQRTVLYQRVAYDVHSTLDRMIQDGYPKSLQAIVERGDGGENLAEYRHEYDVSRWDVPRTGSWVIGPTSVQWVPDIGVRQARRGQ